MERMDWAILTPLEGNGRESFGVIAERVSSSKTPCRNRVQTLERAVGEHPAIIECYTTVCLKRIKDYGPITRAAALLERPL